MISLALMIVVASQAQTPSLYPGAKAPELAVDHWVKGHPVQSLAGEGVYVVEFWSTGNASSVNCIPNLTALAKKNGSATVVGVSIWEDDKDKAVERFVRTMGSKMAYRVAYGGNKTGMAQSWMAAAGQKTIPAAFVVKDGVVQWIGNPKDMELPLAQALAGQTNLPANKAAFLIGLKEGGADVTDPGKALLAIDKMLKSGQNRQAHATMDRLVAAHPEYKKLGEQTSMFWLAAEKPVQFESAVDALLTKGDLGSRNKVFGAVAMMAEEAGLRDLTVATMQKLQKTAKPDDITTAVVAVQIYKLVKDQGQETMAAKQGLQMLDVKKAPANAQLRSYFKKAITGK